MADSTNYFTNLKNKTVKISDVVNGINAYINDYLKGTITQAKTVRVSDQAGTGNVTINPTAVTNGGTPSRGWDTHISWSGTINDSISKPVKAKTDAFLKAHRNKTIYADDLYNLIVNCLFEACRIYYQYYVYYDDTSYKNSHHYRPNTVRSSFYRGVNSGTHVTNDTYKAMANTIRPAILKKNLTIKTKDLDTFLMSLVRYNESKETVVAANSGNRINSCYYSCHSECHGSSRGRR